MMFCSKSCLRSFAVLLIVSPSIAEERLVSKPEEVGVSSAKVKKLSEFMQSLVDQGKIPGGVTMMARHGKLIHFEAVGMANREARKPMTTDAIFRMASMTKPITSVAVMILWEEGKLSLDDPVSKYIPQFKKPAVLVTVDPLTTRPAKREITIRHLLTHTSGLGYNFTDKIGPLYESHSLLGGLDQVTEEPLEQMVKRLAELPILFDPGDNWEYGLSSDVLGRVIEVASGMPLDRFIDEKICQPLQMHDTFFKIPPDKTRRLVAAYHPKNEQLTRLLDGESLPDGQRPDRPYHASHKFLSGGGGLCSTAEDYMRFCQMLLNGGELDGKRLLEKSTVDKMYKSQTGAKVTFDAKKVAGLADKFGFGLATYGEQHPLAELRGAYAWFGFWTTSFRVSPKGDWILITLSQLPMDFEVTPKWFAEYDRIAAEAIAD